MTDTENAEQAVAALWGVALAIGASVLLIVVVGWILLRTARLPFPSSVTMSLTLLATIALTGYAVGGEARPELAAIAGTAVGALAGGVTALLGDSRGTSQNLPQSN